MDINFKNRTIIITGATKGIGKVTAELFAKEEGNIILTGTKNKIVDELNLKYSDKKRKYFCVDFSNTASINDFLLDLNKYPQIDICINNAGINIIDDFIDTKVEDFDLIMNVNLKGHYLINRYAAARMKDDGYGRIINIASIWSKITRPKRALYTISKNAIHGMTQTMGIELAKYNVLVNTVSPGFTLTELTQTTNTVEELEQISKMIPIGRMAEPKEIARTILFLASEMNTYITGQNIMVEGGYTIV